MRADDSTDDDRGGLRGPHDLDYGERAVYRTILFMLAVLVLALIVTIRTIEVRPVPVYHARPDPSPYGYTYSLSLFAFPMVALGLWLARSGLVGHMRAVRLTVSLLLPLWCLLDILLGNLFFRFPVKSATIQSLWVWAYVPGQGFARSIPLEEFFFYFGGCVVILLLYVWSSQDWFAKYAMSQDEFEIKARGAAGIVSLDRRAVVLGAVVFGLALAYKKLGDHAFTAGFPGYFLVLLALVVLPAALLYRHVNQFINGRAFLFTLMAATLVSLLWEVTLALPYGWWDYHHEQMIGLFIHPWSNLPIEACILWVSAGWAGLFVYETFKIYVHSGASLGHVLFGRNGSAGPPT